ncbi:MAG TPA: hypothetical protein PK514_02440 [Spirochaetota bacterium]|nr:hypothetical protein [Spirochaetota bacterium]
MKRQNENKLILGVKILFYTISILCVFTGLNYILRGDLMPYHYSYLGRTKDQIEGKTLVLLISAAQVIGGMMLGFGAAFGMMTRNIGKSGSKLLPVMTVLAAPPLLVSFRVVLRIGEVIPRALIAMLIILFTAGLLIMYIREKE